MELKQAILERRSIRGFKPDPVPKEILEEVLTMAARAVTAVNAQPWEAVVVTGDTLAKVRKANAEAFQTGKPADFEYKTADGIYRSRRITIAKQLFAAAGISREDKESRRAWSERGFRFFDAPVGILLMMDENIDEWTYRLDVGCFIQNLCLAAMEFGLGTCVEYQGVTYQKAEREILGIPDSKHLVCGIAIGYPDPDYAPNGVVSEREKLENFTTWYGFPD